jgi:hypothetical protein
MAQGHKWPHLSEGRCFGYVYAFGRLVLEYLHGKEEEGLPIFYLFRTPLSPPLLPPKPCLNGFSGQKIISWAGEDLSSTTTRRVSPWNEIHPLSSPV